jgi:hypothetical protein
MSVCFGLVLRQHCQFLILALLLKYSSLKIMNKRKGVPSMPNHKLPKNTYLEKIRSMFQEIVMLQTDLALLMFVIN